MRRPARFKRRVVVGVLGVLSVASAWGLTLSARGASAEVYPRTVREDHAREAAERLAARLAATDSAAIGRVLILPARNHTGRTELDAATVHLDFLIRMQQRREFAQPVPRELTERLDEEVKAWKTSNSMRTQVVYLLKASGAAQHSAGCLLHVSVRLARTSRALAVGGVKRSAYGFPEWFDVWLTPPLQIRCSYVTSGA